MTPVESRDPEHRRWPHEDVLPALWAARSLILTGEHPEHSPGVIDERLALLADTGIVTTIDPPIFLGGCPSPAGLPWKSSSRRYEGQCSFGGGYLR
jgi:hypothetical protein